MKGKEHLGGCLVFLISFGERGLAGISALYHAGLSRIGKMEGK